ncbi:AP-4 complex accessory subunit tepsin [Brachionichthys hirsutus]|uniref:AP-4 complex accessory subunit tepsin n=1 Tax=Brachionichthys hirsutus TaxID=412623 RepID=UPI003604904C
MATFMERLAFLQKLPTLMKATADDENPCPGYLFQEIGKTSHESTGYGQCLLEYLLERLQVESCHVKLKVLKIFVHLCGHGSNHFLTELRRNSTFIQQASVYSGPPDPVHGTSLYQKVRNTAQEVAMLLFTDTISAKSSVHPLNVAPPSTGMGSETCCRSGMQGFGYSPGKQGAAGSGSLLSKIQKAAEAVASAVLPPTERQGIRLHENHYRAVRAPPGPIELAMPACAYNMSAPRPKAPTKRHPGQVGGGWEETDSGSSSSHNSSQDMAANSRASQGSKSAGTGSQSGASREGSGDLSERVEALHFGDCGQEMALVSRLTDGSKVFLSREESQHFIKECSILNCEVVLELLSRRLQDPSNTAQMRALCALSCLLTSDLLSLEQMFGAAQRRLLQLSEGAPGPAANKATKILRQFEALMGGSPHTPWQDAENGSHQTSTHQLSTSTYSGLLLPTHPPSSSDLSPGDSAGEQTNNGEEEEEEEEEEQEFVQNQVEQSSTEVATKAEERALDTERGCAPPAEPQHDRSCSGRLSLFSGMELVTKGRPLCQRESFVTDKGLKENLIHDNAGVGEISDDVCDSVASDRSQRVSAFSFLNF